MSKNAKPLPKTPLELPGGVIAERKRCGKPNCRCARGKPSDRHGPYHYRMWRAGGCLRKTYVPRDQVRRVRAACARRQEREREERARRAEFRQILSTFKQRSREVERTLAAIRRLKIWP